MPGRVRECQPGTRRQVFYAALALAEMLKQFEAMRMAKGLRNRRKARKNMLFRTDH